MLSFRNLKYEMDHTCYWLILPFWVSISSCSPSGQTFYCFFMVFRKEKIDFADFNEKSTLFSSEICFGYFEQIWKNFADYQVKTITNEKTNHNDCNYWQLQITTYNKKWLPTTRRETTTNSKGLKIISNMLKITKNITKLK